MSPQRMPARMSPQRIRMIEDMILARLAGGTQKRCLRAGGQLAAYCRRAPDQLSEEELRRHLLGLHQLDVARDVPDGALRAAVLSLPRLTICPSQAPPGQADTAGPKCPTRLYQRC